MRPSFGVAIILIAALWFGWVGRYCLPTVGARRVPLTRGGRFEYAVARGKNALPAVLLLNAQIEAGEIPEDVRVYGFWMEQHRSYCDFALVGSIFGYADHEGFVECVNRGPGAMMVWLEAYDCDYLLFDRDRFQYAEQYFEMVWPERGKTWRQYFRSVMRNEGVELWQVRGPPVERIPPPRAEKKHTPPA